MAAENIKHKVALASGKRLMRSRGRVFTEVVYLFF